MKFKRTDHWKNRSSQGGLLFFAQIIDEALFDYSLDSYKPKALNVRLLCIECLQTIELIKFGVIAKPNLKYILEELIWNLEHDFASKSILGEKLEMFVERIKKFETNHLELKGTISHLYHHFDKQQYLNHIKEYLCQLVPENKEKENIYNLAKTYLTELINYGYLPGYIYYQVNAYFFDRTRSVKETSPLPFLNIFNFEKKKFKVIFRAASVFNEFSPIAKQLNFTINEKYENNGLQGKEKDFIDNKQLDETFIIFENIESTNELSARYQAELPIERIANMFSFYHHREKPKIVNKAIVINIATNQSILLDKPIKSIIKKEDVSPKIAVKKVKNIFENVDLPMDTIVRVTKAIDIHSIALETEEIENKLLNLWTAIETLIPKDLECGQDRIVQIIEGLAPFQNINYIKNRVNEVASDFFSFNKREASAIIKKVITKKKENRWHSIAALLLTKENEPNRSEIYKLLDDFPLLRYRIFSTNKCMENGKKVKKILVDHNQRVEWQIRRMYRVRNLIVHSGEMPPYTNMLVENLHNYYDNLMNYILDAAGQYSIIKSIKEGIISCDIEYKMLMKNVEKISDTEITLDNFAQIV